MQMAHRNFNIFKKIIITMISWSLLLTPTANALAQQETPPPQQETSTNAEEPSPTQSEETTEVPSNSVSTDANYCHADGSAKSCPAGQVYNCHLETCVAEGDQARYNREYTDCGANKKCQEDLKADAKMFTEHKKSDPKNGDAQTLKYASAIAQAAMGCAMLAGSALCNVDYIGGMYVGIIMLAMALMTALSDDYKDVFKKEKKRLEELDTRDEKGWNHTSQAQALETEISILEAMEKAASKKMKHHKRTMTLLMIPIIASIICIASTYFTGCVGSNPCSTVVVVAAAAAILLEKKAHDIAADAKASASSAKSNVKKVLEKLKSRYNKQAIAGRSQGLSMGGVMSRGAQTSALQTTGQDTTVEDKKIESLGEMPELKINMGVLGKNGENVGNAIDIDGLKTSWNKTRETKNPKHINDAVDTKAATISKVARKVLLSASKQKDLPQSTKDAISAVMNPNSLASQKFLDDHLRKSVSPIQAALNFRKAGGSSAKKAIAESSKAKEVIPAYDISSKDYLKNIKAKLQELEDFTSEENGILAMGNYGDPTVDSNAVDQLNQDNKDPKETIHKDSGVSLWKIISNRYNEIKLKKILD